MPNYQKSGQITSANTSQLLLSESASRVGFWIQNTSIYDLWIRDNSPASNAAPSFKIPADYLYETPNGSGVTTSWYIVGESTEQTFTYKEW